VKLIRYTTSSSERRRISGHESVPAYETAMAEMPIKVAYPATEDLHLRVALAACHFKAEPGEAKPA
jgi:hypothetical protein